RSERRIVRRSAEVARLPGVQTCAVLVGVDVVGPTVTGERPVEEPLGIVWVGYVDNRQDAADAANPLANVVRLSVVGPAAHVAKAIGHRDAGRQLRVRAITV